MPTPEINPNSPQKPNQAPGSPEKGKTFLPNQEGINPAKPGTNTEVDLDKTKTYPDKKERRQ
ncbi:MAG: hypothetical protein NDI69_01400 [Bacteriovoracaceae bacterium]|nr:hypothetical protein [Bacteriovoracaceae bacterium]